MSNWELDLLGTESLRVGEGRAIVAEGTANARDTSEHHGRLAWREGEQKSREWPKMWADMLAGPDVLDGGMKKNLRVLSI